MSRQQLCTAATRTRVSSTGADADIKSSRKRSNSSAGHFDRCCFSLLVPNTPQPSRKRLCQHPPREGTALVSLPRAGAVRKSIRAVTTARQSVFGSSRGWVALTNWTGGLELRSSRMSLSKRAKTGTSSREEMHGGARRCTHHGCSHAGFAWTSGYRAPDFQPSASLHQCASPPLKRKARQTRPVRLQAQLCQNSHFLATGRLLIPSPPLQKTSMLTRNVP